MSNGLITRVRGGADRINGAITLVRGRSAPSWYGLVTSVRGKSIGTVTVPVDAGLPVTYDPFEVGALTGSPDTVDVASWAWTQETGPTVSLVGTGPTRQYITPATRAGTTLGFRVTATFTDTTSTTATVTHTIRGHGGPWVYHLGALTGVGVNPPVL